MNANYKGINDIAAKNLSQVSVSFLIIPILLILAIFYILYHYQILDRETYTHSQKALFLYGNAELSQYPQLMLNMTQLGDGLVLLSLLTMLFLTAPKCWESFISAIIISGILTAIFKRLFSIPRPAAAFLHDHFVILGPKLSGHNSFPSGHSITTFTILSIVLLAFLPVNWKYRILWCTVILALGTVTILTRIGVGAHHPLDVLVGAIVGYLSAILGILISEHFKVLNWISNQKYYPIFIVVFLAGTIALVSKILEHNLFIFYFALLNLLLSIFFITKNYVKKKL